jgi:formiminoglutamase
MSGASSNADAWFTRLERLRKPELLLQRADDQRLGEIIEFWDGNPQALTAGRAVIVGFPHDQGVKRNHGRAGAAQAPAAIRQALYRLTRWDSKADIDLARARPLELGNIPAHLPLEEAQDLLGSVVATLIERRAVPVVLGGGHETAYGQYLGYVAARRPAGIINFDAHLDIRPLGSGPGTSGTPFRQAMEHPNQPLDPRRYVCLGAQPFSVSRDHCRYLIEKGGTVRWAAEISGRLVEVFQETLSNLAGANCTIFVSFDADAVHCADVPGVSAPNPEGLRGSELTACARIAGRASAVSSVEIAEINPSLDRANQSARWASLVIWNVLAGLAQRP